MRKRENGSKFGIFIGIGVGLVVAVGLIFYAFFVLDMDLTSLKVNEVEVAPIIAEEVSEIEPNRDETVELTAPKSDSDNENEPIVEEAYSSEEDMTTFYNVSRTISASKRSSMEKALDSLIELTNEEEE